MDVICTKSLVRHNGVKLHNISLPVLLSSSLHCWPLSCQAGLPFLVLFIRFYFIHFSRLNSISIILFWENTGSASENYQVFEISNHSCYSSMYPYFTSYLTLLLTLPFTLPYHMSYLIIPYLTIPYVLPYLTIPYLNPTLVEYPPHRTITYVQDAHQFSSRMRWCFLDSCTNALDSVRCLHSRCVAQRFLFRCHRIQTKIFCLEERAILNFLQYSLTIIIYEYEFAK